MHLFILWCRVYWPDGAIIQYIYLNRVYLIARPDCALVGKEKYIFTQETFYLQGILNDINVLGTFFLECKHKHMIKSGAPPDKTGALYSLLLIDFHGFTSRIDFQELSLLGFWSYLSFLETV